MDFWTFLQQLFLRPQDFFKQHMKQDIMKLPFSGVAIFLFVVFWWLDRAERILLKAIGRQDGDTIMNYIAEEWMFYWILVFTGGIITGWLMYLLGGWFFWLRIKWSKWKITNEEHRNIFLYSFFFITLAYAIVTLIDTFLYSSPLETYTSEQLVSQLIETLWFFVIFITISHSLFMSYKGVMQIEWVVKGRAIVWFVILPALYYLILFILATFAFAFIGSL